MHFEICLNDLRFYAYHGVLEHEKVIGNEFKVDISIVIPCNEKIVDDNLENTVSYAEIYEIIKAEMEKRYNLLEKLAYEIVQKLKNSFPIIKSGEISIEKMRPPIKDMLGTATVKLKF